ncbi:hypothetical protein D770_14205 [Flammeovirgaceae bacterium 311]|nr:hypothetical protein D770_14205 [Flammeovirgaceae bacterium 311]
MQPNTISIDQDYKRVLHIGTVALSYYQFQRSAPTEQDYAEWLSLLPELMRNRYKTQGFENAKTSIDFCRYFIMLRKREMAAYMQKNLCPEDYQLWLEKKDTPSNPW